MGVVIQTWINMELPWFHMATYRAHLIYTAYTKDLGFFL